MSARLAGGLFGTPGARILKWLVAAAAVAALDGGTPANGTGRCPCASSDERGPFSLPGYLDDYGLGCRPHDLNTTSCAQPASHPWCNQSWCYVQPGCALPTVYREQLPARGLSYATCGYLSAWSSSLIGSALRNVTVQVVVLSNTGGWKGSYCTPATPTSCFGPTYTYWIKVLESAGAVVNVTLAFTSGTWKNGELPYPPEVMRQFRQDLPTSQSLFTACVYATGMGYVDVCIGAFSLTPSRRQASTTVETHSVQMYLVSLGDPDYKEPLLTTVLTVFRVFAPDLWVVIVAVTICMSLLMAWHEYYDFDDDEFEMFKGLGCREKLEVCVYHGIASLLSGGGNTFEPTNRPSRMVSLGLSLFVLLTISTYTANLASFLVATRMPPAVLAGLADAQARGFQICVVDSDADVAIANTGVLPTFLRRVAGKGDTVTGLLRGDCGAAIMEDEVFESARGGGGDNCRLAKIGDPLFALDTGSPVSERTFRALEVYANKMKTDGAWKKVLDSAMVHDRCGGGNDAPTQQMSLQAFSGPILLTGGFIVVSFMLQFGNCVTQTATKQWHRFPGAAGRFFRTRSETRQLPKEDQIQMIQIDDKLMLKIPASRLGQHSGAHPGDAHVVTSIEIQVLGDTSMASERSSARRSGVRHSGVHYWDASANIEMQMSGSASRASEHAGAQSGDAPCVKNINV